MCSIVLAFIREMGYFCCRCGASHREKVPQYTKLETLQKKGYFRDLKEIKKPSIPKIFKTGDFVCPVCVRAAKDEAAANKLKEEAVVNKPRKCRPSYKGLPNDRDRDAEIEKLKRVRFLLAVCLLGLFLTTSTFDK